MAKTKLEEILRAQDCLPRAQRKLCAYLAGQTEEADWLTARQLAQKAGVGEATVFRFLKEQGYPSYTAFRADVHRYAVEFVHSSYWQMRASMQSGKTNENQSPLGEKVAGEIDLLGKMVTAKLQEQFAAAVDAMLACEQVGVLGLRSSKAVALYFYYLLLPFFDKVCQFSQEEHFLFEQISRMPQNSALFVITSWPNTTMTVSAARYAHQQGHRIVLLTNNVSCPITEWADLLLLTPEAKDHFTILPYIAVVEALAQQIGQRQSPETLNRLQRIDQILAEQRVTDWEEKDGAVRQRENVWIK
ncbi:MAG: MurR/RpiR family transcriptional regulator [Pygmaiobacter massiliensis]|nr:MurR/RpiR family transcriptional regulator [Pygmaiobacter massiliensis]